MRDAELPLPRPDFVALPIAQTDQQHARRVDARRQFGKYLRIAETHAGRERHRMIAGISVAGQGDVGMSVYPDHGRVIPVLPGQKGERSRADGAVAPERHDPVGIAGTQHAHGGPRLGNDRIAVEHSVRHPALRNAVGDGNRQRLHAAVRSQKGEQLRSQKISSRRIVGIPYLGNPSDDVAALPLGINQANRSLFVFHIAKSTTR